MQASIEKATTKINSLLDLI